MGRDVIRKYLTAIRAWHLAQGWPAPLSSDQLSAIDFHLRGLERHVGARRVPPRPPVTIHMLAALRADLNLNDPFDACVWAAAACAFWGLMRFGEVTVPSRAAFDGSKHIKRMDALSAYDVNGKLYARLDLPAAKTAKTGEIQSVYLVIQVRDSLIPSTRHGWLITAKGACCLPNFSLEEPYRGGASWSCRSAVLVARSEWHSAPPCARRCPETDQFNSP